MITRRHSIVVNKEIFISILINVVSYSPTKNDYFVVNMNFFLYYLSICFLKFYYNFNHIPKAFDNFNWIDKKCTLFA